MRNIDPGNVIHDFEKLEIPLIDKLFRIYVMTHRIIFSFPKFERYTLGEKFEEKILEAVESIIIANGSGVLEKDRMLQRVNAKIELLKQLLCLAQNCNLVDIQQFLELSREISTAGKMTQGWIKYTRNRS